MEHEFDISGIRRPEVPTQSQIEEKWQWRGVAIILLGALCFAAYNWLRPDPPLEVTSTTPPKVHWEDPIDEVSRTLTAGGARGCGLYKMLPWDSDRRAYTVFCTRDGKEWRQYEVFMGSGEVLGPYKPEQAPPPSPY